MTATRITRQTLTQFRRAQYDRQVNDIYSTEAWVELKRHLQGINIFNNFSKLLLQFEFLIEIGIAAPQMNSKLSTFG